MAEDTKKLLNNLEARIRQLMFVCDTLREENQELKNKLDDCETRINEKQEMYDELNARYLNLKTAQSISGDNADIKETKSRFNKLVREIDKCIALLNE